MTALDAAKSGSFKIGNEFDVNRLGFGAMRITGDGIWGEPKDRTEAIRTLKRLPEIGVNFIDTADSYGPDVSGKLIHEALHPYKDLLVATKGGLERPGPNNWVPSGRPEYLVADLRRQISSCRTTNSLHCMKPAKGTLRVDPPKLPAENRGHPIWMPISQ